MGGLSKVPPYPPPAHRTPRVSASTSTSSRAYADDVSKVPRFQPRIAVSNILISAQPHLRRRAPLLRRSKHDVPIPLHAHDGDAVVLCLVERLGQRAQSELSVVGRLPGCVVMVEKQREPRP